MQIKDAVAHYGSMKVLAGKLNVYPSAVYNWKSRHNGRVPEIHARRLHELTRGRLRFDPSEYL